jgi:hypothetical protein
VFERPSFALVAGSFGALVLLVVLAIWPGRGAGRWPDAPWEQVSALPRAPALAPDRGAVLPLSAAPALLRPCSRAAPPFTSLWTPGARDIAQLEEDLAAYLARADTARTTPGFPAPPLLASYYRQYVGFVSPGGRRLIYVSAFAPAQIGPPADMGRDTASWRREPVMVCDGGDAFWGLEYDPASRRFRGLAFNGVA